MTADSAPGSLPYGSWPSPLSPADAAGSAVRVSAVSLSLADDGTTILRWSEQRPDLGGRIIVRRAPVPEDRRVGPTPGVIDGPEDMSARSGVNEYGGGAFWSDGEQSFWVDGKSSRVMTCPSPGAQPAALTPTPPTPRGWRYAAGVVASGPSGRWIVCEREIHPGSDEEDEESDRGAVPEPVNELAVISVDGGIPTTLVRDGDWSAAPAVSPDGRFLAWLRWGHPDMPWDAAEVWAARLVHPEEADADADAVTPVLAGARRVAGGLDGGSRRGLDRAVAACLPSWDPAGRLWWCDDADDWWQLRRASVLGLPDEGGGDLRPAALDVPGEVGEPRWVSGGRRYGFTGDGRVVLALQRDGLDSVQVWDPVSGIVEPMSVPDGGFTSVEHLDVLGTVVAVAGGGGAHPTSAWTVDLRGGPPIDHRGQDPDAAPPRTADVSMPSGIKFPTGDEEEAHALFYEPTSSVAVGPDSELPPLIVRIHGGPTASARAEYSASVQFWTTRGFAVVDVNYRGSTGYGRRFRDLLNGAWGVADVADCVAAVRWLSEQGLVDPDRCVIRGGSSGGFTALEATCRSDVFAAACSLYGVTDLRALATDTHKFESRYLDGLVGPWPEAADRYRDRSPLHHAEMLSRPVLLLQGEDDPIVPPSQARVLRDALKANGVPHALILFEGEAHGFRSSDTIIRALEAELAFYGQVLGFDPADDLPPLVLER